MNKNLTKTENLIAYYFHEDLRRARFMVEENSYIPIWEKFVDIDSFDNKNGVFIKDVSGGYEIDVTALNYNELPEELKYKYTKRVKLVTNIFNELQKFDEAGVKLGEDVIVTKMYEDFCQRSHKPRPKFEELTERDKEEYTETFLRDFELGKKIDNSIILDSNKKFIDVKTELKEAGSKGVDIVYVDENTGETVYSFDYKNVKEFAAEVLA